MGKFSIVSKRIRLAFQVFALLWSSATPAFGAATIGFENLANGSVPASWTEGAFTLTFSPGDGVGSIGNPLGCGPPCSSSGSKAFYSYFGNSTGTLTISATDGSLFSLQSLRAATVFTTQNTPLDLHLSGSTQTGVVTANLQVAGGLADSFSTLSPAGFDAISSLSISGSATNLYLGPGQSFPTTHFALDNILLADPLGAPPPPPPPPPVLNIKDSVRVEIIDAAMTATFDPSNGMTLSEAAASLGFDHFNWVQVITRYDGILRQNDPPYILHLPPLVNNTPFLDAPYGGFAGRPADYLPYYWDETPGNEVGYQLSDHTIGDSFLQFLDEPGIVDPLLGLFDPQMHFTTSLVGVVEGDEWVPLYTWNWQSNKVNGEGGPSLRQLPNEIPGTGGVMGFQVLSNPWEVPDAVRTLWTNNGAVAPVPEPETWILTIIGFGFIGSMLRRRPRQTDYWMKRCA